MDYDIRLRKVKNGGKLKATFSLTLDDEIVINEFKLIKGENGYFIGYPSKQGKDDKYYNTVYILSQKFSKRLLDDVVDMYNNLDD